MTLDYFYGQAGELFSFYRIPKALFQEQRFQNLSTDAKTLYGILLDRMSLSVKNGWLDEQNRVFIIFTIEDVKRALCCADNKATKLLRELEKFGLIERKRRGLGKPSLVYVKNFSAESSKSIFQNRDFHDSGGFKNASQDPSKSRCNKTKENDTEMSETDPFYSEESDGMSKRTQLEEYFSQSLEVDLLLRLCPDDEDTIYQIVDLLVDTCATNRKTLRIAGDDKPAEVVRSRFMKLNADHIRFVLKCLAENSSPIRNMKQYLLASLYNAPTTMQLSYEAALCRERADWMVGINASRLFSCLYNQPLAVGRVMTPVLAMTVVREAAITAFTPEKFYTVALTLADGGTASSKRFAQKADAELLLSRCRKEGRVTVQKMERKEKSENPPQLYDLTALQWDANRLLGFTAQQTLDYAQSLYEKRLITYPRTDSRFLTEDMAASLPGLVTDTGKAFAMEEPLPIHVQQVINSSKVTDHHALLPTKSMANAELTALPAGERNVLRLIAARLLCAVGEPHRYAETSIITICAGEEFSAKGKVVLSEGWKATERKMLGELLGKQKEPAVLPDVQEQSQCSVAGAELKEGQTSPPKSYTEDTLLSAMQAAGADNMPEGVERQGIGTPATRAATIEKLVQKGFLERKGTKKTKALLPTDKGKALITVMPEEIQSPEMTADWETKLLQIERGEMEPSEFMTEINTMITELVKNTEMKKGANALMKNKIFGVCPNCGKPVVEREKGWFCENRECRFVLWKDNAFFKRLGKRLDSHVADRLLRDGRVRLKDCKSAKGKTYNATVLLGTEPDGRSKFSLDFEGGC